MHQLEKKDGNMKHIFIEHTNCLEPGTCPICDGGLAVCRVCGLLEGSLTTDCPGYLCWAEKNDDIYQGKIDFVNGHWVNQPSPHSPAYYRQIDHNHAKQRETCPCCDGTGICTYDGGDEGSCLTCNGRGYFTY